MLGVVIAARQCVKAQADRCRPVFDPDSPLVNAKLVQATRCGPVPCTVAQMPL